MKTETYLEPNIPWILKKSKSFLEKEYQWLRGRCFQTALNAQCSAV